MVFPKHALAIVKCAKIKKNARFVIPIIILDKIANNALRKQAIAKNIIKQMKSSAFHARMDIV